MFLIARASMNGSFISENGIAAALGDDQFVKGGIQINNRPLSHERGHMDRIRGNDPEPV